MTRRQWAMTLACLFGLLGAGCADSVGERLIGIWQSERAGPSASGAESRWTRGALELASVRLEFRADGSGTRSSSLLGGTTVEAGRWRVVDAQRQRATLQLSADGFRTFESWRIEFLDDDRFSTTLPGLGIELEFARLDQSG